MAFIVFVSHDEKQIGRLVAEVKRGADALEALAASLAQIASGGTVTPDQLNQLQQAADQLKEHTAALKAAEDAVQTPPPVPST